MCWSIRFCNQLEVYWCSYSTLVPPLLLGSILNLSNPEWKSRVWIFASWQVLSLFTLYMPFFGSLNTLLGLSDWLEVLLMTQVQVLQSDETLRLCWCLAFLCGTRHKSQLVWHQHFILLFSLFLGLSLKQDSGYVSLAEFWIWKATIHFWWWKHSPIPFRTLEIEPLARPSPLACGHWWGIWTLMILILKPLDNILPFWEGHTFLEFCKKEKRKEKLTVGIVDFSL